jgi:hypothetical protein
VFEFFLRGRDFSLTAIASQQLFSATQSVRTQIEDTGHHSFDCHCKKRPRAKPDTPRHQTAVSRIKQVAAGSLSVDLEAQNMFRKGFYSPNLSLWPIEAKIAHADWYVG